MKRNIGIDLAKTIAIICVIAIHISGPLFSVYPMGSTEWKLALIMSSAVRCAVPLFFMCSGALLLAPDKEITVKKLFSKTIPRIVAAMVFWGMAYKIFHLAQADSLSWASIFHAFKEVLVFNHEYHFYYMHIILIVYVLLPVTRIFVKNASKQMLGYSLAVWIALAVIMPASVQFYPFNLLGGMTYQWCINMTYAAVGYGILGYYLKSFPLTAYTSAALAAAGYVVILCGTYYTSAQTGCLNEIFFSGMSPGSLLLACGIYGLCMKCRECRVSFINKAVILISKASFCIYLVHVMFINILANNGYTAAVWCPVVSIPLFTLAVFALSLAVYRIIYLIPWARKWII